MRTPFLSKLFLGAAVLSLSLMTSCKDENKSETETEAVNTTGTSTSTTTSDDKEVAQVNPAHGLPGHRCDIPVGAPLNSAAAMQTTPAATTPAATSTTVSPIRVDKTPSVNPPHGEPGHDCAVPVGAPLK